MKKNNEANFLAKKKNSIIEKIKSIITNMVKTGNKQNKYFTENSEFNFLEDEKSKEEIEELEKLREQEIKARIEAEKKYGMTYDELLKQSEIKVLNNLSDEEMILNNYDPDLEEFETNEGVTENLIKDKKSYNEVITKLNSGEITDDNLSISDLLKINAMLKAEIDIKTEKIKANKNILEEIERLEKENNIIEEKLNRKYNL